MTSADAIREVARHRWPLTSARLAEAAQRARVPLYVPATPANIVAAQAALKEAEQRGALGRRDPADIARRSLDREGRDDHPIARHASAAEASPRERQLFRLAASYANRVAKEGGDVPLPEVEPGEAEQFRDLCIKACRRGIDRHRGRRRAARAAQRANTEEPR